MTNILILCTGNSCRSQMAEAILRSLNLQQVQIYSAGIETHGLNPWAMKVLEEINLPIDKLYSKNVEDLKNVNFDYVLTVCSHANETCPQFNGEAKVLHHSFDDPPAIAKSLTDENQILDIYRNVRNQIHDFLKNEFVIELKL